MTDYRLLPCSACRWEVLAQIVRAVGGQAHGGKTLLADTLALSEVNLGFWNLCKAAIWRSPDLLERNNAELLYFYSVILPRHGSLVRMLRGVHAGNNRLDLGIKIVPTYIQEALGISTRIDSPTSPSTTTSNPLDLCTLGEKLLLPLGSTTDPTSDDLIHASSVAFQRAKIISLILDLKKTPNLDQLTILITTRHLSYEDHLSSIREALGDSRLILLHVDFEDPVHPLDPNYERRSYSALAKLISSHTGIEDLSIQQKVVDLAGNTIDTLDSRLTDIDPSLLSSIRNLKALEGLTLVGLPIRKSYLMDFSIGPLKAMKIDRLEIGWEDCIKFLNESHMTLNTAALIFYDGPPASDQQPVPPSDVKPFLNLKQLHLGGMLPTSVLTNFRSAPLEHLDTFIFEKSSVGEWIGLIEEHRSTLESLVVNGRSLTEVERGELEAAASARGVVFEWGFF